MKKFSTASAKVICGNSGLANGKIKTIGRQIQTSLESLDTVIESFLAQPDAGLFSNGLTPGFPHHEFKKCGIVSVSSTREAGFSKWSATYQGFLHEEKRPTGGMDTGLGEQPIQIHPNYKASTAWPNATVFGEGKGNPNAYGRVERQGRFAHFGPLPNGQDGAVAPADVPGASELQGVTSYLTANQPRYRYTRVTTERWAPTDKIGKTFDEISSGFIPVEKPEGIGDTNWLLTSIDEDATELNNSWVAWTTTIEFTLSMTGKWNPLLYESGETNNYNLDIASRPQPSVSGS